VGPHALVNVSVVPCRIHVTIAQDRMSFDRNFYVVLYLAESDPVYFVDMGEESSTAPGSALAGSECVDAFNAPEWFEKTSWCHEWHTARDRSAQGLQMNFYNRQCKKAPSKKQNDRYHDTITQNEYRRLRMGSDELTE
jgi:hypothetical protein